MPEATQGQIDARDQQYTLIMTETGGPNSYDPLDGDATNNLPVFRMMYATPVEVTLDNSFTSRVLKRFEYNKSQHRLVFEMKPDLKFSDGQALTVDDLTLAIARMALKRPKFPVIKEIRGLAAWAKSKAPLRSRPDGMVVKGQTLEIQFERDVDSPLLRFALELFSIVPKSCIDLSSAKLVCSRPPASGPYELEQDITVKSARLRFRARPGFADNLPKELVFEYRSAAEIDFSNLPLASVVSGNEFRFTKFQLDSLASARARYLPASRFVALELRPIGVFQSVDCRREFARDFRDAVAKLDSRMESSLFVKLLPGYLSNAELRKRADALEIKARERAATGIAAIQSSATQTSESPGKARTQKTCANKTAIQKWGYTKGEERSTYVLALMQIMSKWSNTEPIVFTDRAQYTKAYTDGDINVMWGSSGFWAGDPAGDVRMLFTPNLHETLKDATASSALQTELADLSTRESFERANVILYSEALVNVFSHSRRFYVTRDERLLRQDLPFAITAPAPWMAFQ